MCWSFNTSHVVIYRNHRKRNANSSLVSIHLMLLFILYFVFYSMIIFEVSIHLMLLFISVIVFVAVASPLFQYISCCYLSHTKTTRWISYIKVSIHLMLLFIGMMKHTSMSQQSFNTSHVVIYLF